MESDFFILRHFSAEKRLIQILVGIETKPFCGKSEKAFTLKYALKQFPGFSKEKEKKAQLAYLCRHVDKCI
jgi:hypothetical protein